MSADSAPIDDLISRFFAVFDNQNGRRPTSGMLNSLFAPGAVVAAHTTAGVVVSGVEEFARPRVELLSSGRLVNFSEWETSSENTVNGSLAIRRSRYSKTGRLDGQPYEGSGTKFFQLAKLPEGWRIVALSWIDDV